MTDQSVAFQASAPLVDARGFATNDSLRKLNGILGRVQALLNGYQPSGDYAPAGDYQPLNGDLTTISGQTNTTFGLGLLTLADAPSTRTLLSVYSKAEADALYQPLGFYVRYDAQTLTTPQQVQARTNINAQVAGSYLTSVSASGDVTAPSTTSGALVTTLAASGVTAGSYGSATVIPGYTVDAKGRITAVTTYTLAAYQPLDSDLTAIAALTTTTYGRNLLTQTSATALMNSLSASDLTTGTLPDARLSNTITAGGPTGSSNIVPVITYDAHGRLTAVTTATITPAAIGAQPSGSYLTSVSASGDISAPSSTSGALVTTLASIVTAAGPIGSASTVPVVTIDAKGRVTALTSAAITYPAQTVTLGGDVTGTGNTGTTIATTVTNVIRYDVAQSLTATQKQQALANTSGQLAMYFAGGVDAAATIVVASRGGTYVHTFTLTATRVLNLSATGAWSGLRWRITRKSTGTGTLNVTDLASTTLLKALATNTWMDAEFDGTNWQIVAYGTL